MRDDCPVNVSGSRANGARDAAISVAAGNVAGPAGCDVPATTLVLPPEASAPRDARSWVVGVLAGWPGDSVDRARLLVSELVTNAVLHARTELTVKVRPDGNGVRFEVRDGDRGGPMPKRYVTDSPTGRGMRLVAGLARAWGVDRGAQGKAIWFTLTPDMGAPPSGGLPMDLVDLTELDASPGEPAADPGSFASGSGRSHACGGLPTLRVQILQLPLGIYLEAEQHNDAVLRELDLIERSPERGPQVPPRLLELAAGVRALFASATTSSRTQVEEAIRTHKEVVDLQFDVPVTGWEALVELADQLDELDRYCEEGALLTLAATPDQRRFRRWYARQLADQAQGRPPTPWPGKGG